MDYSQDRWEFETRIQARPGAAILVSLSINNASAADLEIDAADLQGVVDAIKAMLRNVPGSEAVIGNYIRYVRPDVSAL